jgi:hypothetical protein
MKRLGKWLSVRMVGALLFTIALVIAIAGFLNQHYQLPLIKPFEYFLVDFYANISTELFSIAITILLIDRIYESSRTKELKQQLIRQMGSLDSGFSQVAVDELNAHGWSQDGSLRGLRFYSANLPQASLDLANLEETNFSLANLRKASIKWANLRNTRLKAARLENSILIGTNLYNSNLSEAHLGGAYLIETNLQEVDLQGAILDGACIWGANLRGAQVTEEQLRKVIMLHATIMPDGNKYDGRFNLKGDVLLANEKHPVDDISVHQEFLLTGYVRENESHARQYLRWKWASEKVMED